MRCKHYIWLLAIAMAGWFAGPVLAAEVAPVADISQYVDAINRAADPSTAIAAYASGLAIDRSSLVLNEAYVRRMVDFGLPEMAYHQAQLVTGLNPGNGVAWAVVAYGRARRNEMPAALSAAVLAVRRDSENEFVQRIAGELLGWYDAAPRMDIELSLVEELEQARRKVMDKPAFIEQYNESVKAYKEAMEQPAPGAALPSAEAQEYLAEPAPEELLRERVIYVPTYETTYVAPVYYWWWPFGFHGTIFFPRHIITHRKFHDRFPRPEPFRDDRFEKRRHPYLFRRPDEFRDLRRPGVQRPAPAPRLDATPPHRGLKDLPRQPGLRDQPRQPGLRDQPRQPGLRDLSPGRTGIAPRGTGTRRPGYIPLPRTAPRRAPTIGRPSPSGAPRLTAPRGGVGIRRPTATRGPRFTAPPGGVGIRRPSMTPGGRSMAPRGGVGRSGAGRGPAGGRGGASRGR